MDDLDLGATIKGFSAGQKVFNRFALKKILGRGGMGVVWLAHDEDLERDVALKFLPEIVALDRESVAELKRETRRNLELTHPHIVRIYDFVQDARAAAISMEFINGASLSGLKTEHTSGVFPLADVTRWAAQLCEALSYAHGSAKVVHRDLKPANLMITKEGDLKVTDFGIACSIADSVSRVSKDIGSSGTPLYMSPQQMMGDRPMASDDIYSLGATLYELLAGKPPFYTGNIILQVQNKQPPAMSARRQELHLEVTEPIPDEWETVIASCLAKDPAQRPPSIATVAERLKLSGSFTAGAKVDLSPPPVRAPVAPAATPATSPIAPTPAKVAPAVAPMPSKPKGAGFWVAMAASVAVVAGAVFWFGDGPNRLKASQRMKEAQSALFSSDWATALTALRDAATLRPTDLEYRREFDEAQRRWLEMVEKEIAGTDPRTTYDRLIARAPAAVALVEPYSETFRRMSDEATRSVRQIVQGAINESRALIDQRAFGAALSSLDQVKAHASLVAEHPVAVRAVRVARLRDGIAVALNQAEQFNFSSAYATLESVLADAELAGAEHAAALQQVKESDVRDQLGKVRSVAQADRFAEALAELARLAEAGILPSAVAEVKAEVQLLAEAFSLNRLARALLAANAAEADAAVEDYAAYTGSKFAVKGAELVNSRDLGTFLPALQELRMRPAEGQTRTNGRDVALVSAMRDRFADREAVTAFLRKELSDWSRVEETAGRPGLALYLHQEAKREGAPTDTSRENRLQAALAADVGFRISWSAPTMNNNTAEPLRSQPLQTLRSALEQRIAPFAQTTANVVPGVVAIATAISGPTDTNNPARQRRTSRYQSGTRQVDNNLYYQLQSQLESAEDDVQRAQNGLQAVRAEAQRQANSAGNNPNAALASALVGGIGVGVAQNTLNKAIDARNNLRSRLRNTSRTLTEAVYAEEPYEVITHNMTYSAEISATPQGARTPVRWSAQLTHQTTEVNGNASRGVPVQKPTYPSAAALNQQLSQQLVERARDIATLEKGVANASFSAISDRAQRAKKSSLELADDQAGLLFLWRSIKVEPDVAANAEGNVRMALGLPRR